MVRTFFAVKIDVSDELRSLLVSLRGTGESIKVVDPDNLHITFKFLGEIDVSRITPIAQSVKQHIDIPPFDIVVTGTGTFGRGTPSVLWAGVHDDGQSIRIAHAIDGVTSKFGFAVEKRRFLPHLTLARVRQGERAKKALAVLDEWSDSELGRCHIDRISFIRSTLTPNGPIYDILENVELCAQEI